jgi:hypothetical protein
MRLDTLTYQPWELENSYRAVLPYCRVFADRHLVCQDCPPELRILAEEYCARKNRISNASVLRAYRARLLP